jgi:hypothetical protein
VPQPTAQPQPGQCRQAPIWQALEQHRHFFVVACVDPPQQVPQRLPYAWALLYSERNPCPLSTAIAFLAIL